MTRSLLFPINIMNLDTDLKLHCLPEWELCYSCFVTTSTVLAETAGTYSGCRKRYKNLLQPCSPVQCVNARITPQNQRQLSGSESHKSLLTGSPNPVQTPHMSITDTFSPWTSMNMMEAIKHSWSLNLFELAPQFHLKGYMTCSLLFYLPKKRDSYLNKMQHRDGRGQMGN